MTVPSVVFAEANWYGSLRGGLTVGGGVDAKFSDQGSRWGIRGSNEVSEGLSANYRFEHKFSTSNASQAGGRLAYVGLTGGFGTVSLGQIWSASYNAIGGLSDPAWVNSDTQTSYRVGNALSYAVSAGSVSLQVDAIMEGGTVGVDDSGYDSGGAVDQLEFGLTFNVSDNISIAVAHTSKKDNAFTTAMPYRPASDYVADVPAVMDDPGTTEMDESVPAVPFMPAMEERKGSLNDEESKANHFAIQMGLGGLSAYVTYSQTESNAYADPMSVTSMTVSQKDKATRYGVSGGIGDGGLSFYVMARSLEPASGMKSTKWLAGITKALGSGASAFAEYHDPDDGGSGVSNFGLVVNF